MTKNNPGRPLPRASRRRATDPGGGRRDPEDLGEHRPLVAAASHWPGVLQDRPAPYATVGDLRRWIRSQRLASQPVVGGPKVG